MIIDLTPETFFQHIKKEGPLHVVMHYGATCNPCKVTMPQYELLANHFDEHNITNVKFYRFHQWEQEYRPFIDEHNLNTKGVPTFRYFYYGDILDEETRVYHDANHIKEKIVEVVKGIEDTMGGFNLHES